MTAPNEQSLADCKSAWLAARLPYGQTEAYRFYDGPIDGPAGVEGLLNAWPLDEGYIDYVVGGDSGLVGKNTPITKQFLVDMNEKDGETNISTGYHAIEFLLWGQDLSATGPGTRPATDYSTAANASRRGQYLIAVADLLLENLQTVRDQWKVGATQRNDFVQKANPDASLAKLMRGMGALAKGELAGQRMRAALQTSNQEDEHSCFSDNTHTDIKMNYLGIKNLYLGRYKRVDGTEITGYSLVSLVNDASNSKNIAVQDALRATDLLMDAFPMPFDQALIEPAGRTKIDDTIKALNNLSDKIVDAGLALGIKVNTDI